MSQQVLEGMWEEIIGHANEFVGKRVRVTILEDTSQPLTDEEEYLETVQALREGIESFGRGEGRPAREALEELRQKHGISR